LGLLSPNALVKELEKYDVAIIPMVSGALPNKVFDSIAAGLPMISLGAGDSSDFVMKYDIGWRTSFDHNLVNDILEELTVQNIMEKRRNVHKCRADFYQSNLFSKYESVLIEVHNQCSN
jgi:hypothetical protein